MKQNGSKKKPTAKAVRGKRPAPKQARKARPKAMLPAAGNAETQLRTPQKGRLMKYRLLEHSVLRVSDSRAICCRAWFEGPFSAGCATRLLP